MKNYRIFIYFIVTFLIIIMPFIFKDSMYLYKDLIGDFSTIFTSIILEGIPFILIGSFISALIQLYIPNNKIAGLIPEGNIFGYFVGAFAGLIFPICECAIIPITRGLIKKGLPIGVGITFMLAVPIVNPVVIMSTYYAFYDRPAVVIARTFGGFACAIIIGMLSQSFTTNNKVLKNDTNEEEFYCDCGCNYMIPGESKIKSLINHTNREFLDIVGYLILGAFISSIFQTAQSIGYFNFMQDNPIFKIAFMMFLGFALSLCSEADAFVGRAFLNQYSFAGVMGFLLIGPMLDMKNLIMLYGTFNKKFLIKLSLTIIITVFITCLIFMITSF